VTQNVLLTMVVSVVTSVVATLIAFVVRDSVETQQKIRRIMLGLCIDCAGTVRAFEHLPGDLGEGLKLLNDRSSPSQDNDLKIIRTLPSGVIVSPPLGVPKELVHLLPAEHARSVFLYYDCWERFSELEGRYRELFQTILSDLAKAKTDAAAKSNYEFLREERFDQLTALVHDMYRTINKLAAHCCEILVMSQHYLDQASIDSVELLTEGRWKTWQGIRDSCAKFHSDCESDFSCTVA
jgi:hypothetical protein